MANSTDTRRDGSALISGAQINWNRIYQFAEVASSGSIKAAAQRLGLSPSTLSEHISQLETELSVQLFIREHRRLRLTDAGTRLAAHAKQMFESSKRLIDVVSPIPLGSYPISIGLVPSPSLQRAYSVVGDFLAAFGPLDIKFVHSDHHNLQEGLLDSRFDFGFSNVEPLHRSLCGHLVASSSIGLFVTAPLATRSLHELVQELPLLVCQSETGAKQLAEQVLADTEVEPRTVINSDYPGALVELCSRGLGIGVFSEEQVRSLSADLLKAIRPLNDALRLTDRLYVLWAKDSENSAAVQQLRKLLQIA